MKTFRIIFMLTLLPAMLKVSSMLLIAYVTSFSNCNRIEMKTMPLNHILNSNNKLSKSQFFNYKKKIFNKKQNLNNK